MIIGLIDVDSHNFPNLALMKVSAWHKAQGDIVEWYDLGRPMYDRVYMSKVFSDKYTRDKPVPYNAREVLRGGTGYAIHDVDGKETFCPEESSNLPHEIEHIMPDYSLYGIKDKAYGFLTRGCPRGCDFCHVASKEGRRVEIASPLEEFWSGQKKIVLLDPNILAYKHHIDLLQQLVDTDCWIDMTQGIDARLITEENADLLSKMKMKSVHFAMDTMQSIKPVSRGMDLYKQAYIRNHGSWHASYKRVFMLTNFDTTWDQDMERIEIIRQLGYIPYVMIYDKPHADTMYKELQTWTNVSRAFMAMTFQEFCEYSHPNKSRSEIEGQVSMF